MIKLRGRAVDEIRVFFTGVRPGEDCWRMPTDHSNRGAATAHRSNARVVRMGQVLDLLRRAMEADCLSDAEE